MRTVLFTCDHMLWCLQPFAYLWQKYFGPDVPVLVAGYGRPDFLLPPNMSFHVIDPQCYPADRWTDGVIKFLKQLLDDVLILVLEDYWLNRPVHRQAVATVGRYMAQHPDVLRCDLTTDRLMSGHAQDVETWEGVEFIETPRDSPYQMSLQACVINRRLYLEALPPNVSPWNLELYGERWIPEGARVLGTRQPPMSYVIGYGTGMGQGKVRLAGLSPEDQEHIVSQGWIPQGLEVMRTEP